MSDPKDDKDLFRSLYGDIERIEDDRATRWHPKPRVSPRPKPQSHAIDEPAISPWPDLDNGTQAGVDTDTYQANGVQNKLVKKLRRGQLRSQASLDLHGMTRVVALQELQAFTNECQHRGINCIHIVHGKGHQSASGKAVLKPSVAVWLRQMPEVLAYCPALAFEGGKGALYVLLKKR
jgi:DNA-nicking Smr family endonuclease